MKVLNKNIKLGSCSYEIIENMSCPPMYVLSEGKNVNLYSNSKGYELLSHYFYLASNLDSNVIYYIPLNDNIPPKLKYNISPYVNVHNYNIVIVNHSYTRLKSKTLIDLLKSKSYTVSNGTIEVEQKIEEINLNELYSYKSKINIKVRGKYLIISTNCELFRYLALRAHHMVIDDNDIENPTFFHTHPVDIEATYKSLELSYFYWK